MSFLISYIIRAALTLYAQENWLCIKEWHEKSDTI